jgi:cyclopropane fatty-acyl-phospholipid synthase-like methyltransferase
MSMHAHPWRAVAGTGATRYEEPLAPAWDVGRPQRAVYELEMAGRIGASVVEVGCGHGEHALWLAQRGHAACGLDRSARAIDKARRRAMKEGIAVELIAGSEDALAGRGFDCALDAGAFHSVPASERPAYARRLAAMVRPGGQLYVLCFSDRETGRGGPARVGRDELTALFSGNGWTLESVDASIIESRLFPGGAAGWLVSARRV